MLPPSVTKALFHFPCNLKQLQPPQVQFHLTHSFLLSLNLSAAGDGENLLWNDWICPREQSWLLVPPSPAW